MRRLWEMWDDYLNHKHRLIYRAVWPYGRCAICEAWRGPDHFGPPNVFGIFRFVNAVRYFIFN